MIAADGKIVADSTTFAPTTEPGKSYLVSSVVLGSGEASSCRVTSGHLSPHHIRTLRQFTNFDGQYSTVFISMVTLLIIW